MYLIIVLLAAVVAEIEFLAASGIDISIPHSIYIVKQIGTS